MPSTEMLVAEAMAAALAADSRLPAVSEIEKDVTCALPSRALAADAGAPLTIIV